MIHIKIVDTDGVFPTQEVDMVVDKNTREVLQVVYEALGKPALHNYKVGSLRQS